MKYAERQLNPDDYHHSNKAVWMLRNVKFCGKRWHSMHTFVLLYIKYLSQTGLDMTRRFHGHESHWPTGLNATDADNANDESNPLEIFGEQYPTIALPVPLSNVHLSSNTRNVLTNRWIRLVHLHPTLWVGRDEPTADRDAIALAKIAAELMYRYRRCMRNQAFNVRTSFIFQNFVSVFLWP